VKQEPTFEEKVASVDTLAELEGMKYGVEFEAKHLGVEVDPAKMAAIARRRVEIQQSRVSK